MRLLINPGICTAAGRLVLNIITTYPGGDAEIRG